VLDREECARWLAQARHTWESAVRDRDEGDYDWACFKAQQAAELALKAVLRALGRRAVGHGLVALLARLREEGVELDPALEPSARNLDFHYIPPRYPDAFAAGAPFQYYDRQRADQALADAAAILRWAEEAGRDA
jgi:HEPN domain-containing protein